MALIGQEVSAEPWIDVPGDVLDILRLWRPTPLQRAMRLEQALGTPPRIYFPLRARRRRPAGGGGAAVLPDADPGAVRVRLRRQHGMAPLLPMYTLGHDYVPPSIHAGGLRYHGDSPTISALVRDGRMEAVAYPQGKVFDAAVQFAKVEGKIPAPECAHGIRAVIDEALAAKRRGRSA